MKPFKEYSANVLTKIKVMRIREDNIHFESKERN